MDKLEAATRLIKVACGEPYGDGITVTDVGIGYAEPGYHDEETVWALGNWNDKQHFVKFDDDSGAGEWVTDDKTPSRLLKALERIGVEGEWLDEWYRCSNCYKIVRSTPDSYFWKPYYVFTEDGVICADCAVNSGFIDYLIAEYANDPNKVITWCEKEKLEELGWELYIHDREYENGWHPGQDDKPEAILNRIQEETPGKDVIFFINENSQFYISFSAYTKDKESE